MFFSCTFVIKNKQIQGNFRLRLKGVTLTKNLTSQQPSKIENMINDLRRETMQNIILRNLVRKKLQNIRNLQKN